MIVSAGRGAMFSWDISTLPPQKRARHPSSVAYDDEDYDADDDDDSPFFKASIGWRDTDDPGELEISMGVAPQQVFMLQRPVTSSSSGSWSLQETCLLTEPFDRSTPRTLVATLRSNVIVAYDLETQRIKQQFFGHLYEIQDICPAPEAWPGSHQMFATCALSGDVKIWDLRGGGGAPAVTLTCGSTFPINAVVLVANEPSSSCGSGVRSRSATAAAAGASSSSARGSRLGAGMICFAGGVGESVFAWDLRASRAQALYELSTGNQIVNALGWHQGSSSLMASCEAPGENR
jgi:WD40 repeat protein